MVTYLHRFPFLFPVIKVSNESFSCALPIIICMLWIKKELPRYNKHIEKASLDWLTCNPKVGFVYLSNGKMVLFATHDSMTLPNATHWHIPLTSVYSVTTTPASAKYHVPIAFPFEEKITFSIIQYVYWSFLCSSDKIITFCVRYLHKDIIHNMVQETVAANDIRDYKSWVKMWNNWS